MDVTLDCDGGRVRARKVVLATYSPFSQFQYSLVAGLENGREVSTLKQWICGYVQVRWWGGKTCPQALQGCQAHLDYLHNVPMPVAITTQWAAALGVHVQVPHK